MAKVELQVHAWQERGIQLLLLLSFALQLVLLVLAEFRRRIDSGMLRAAIWSAYMLADWTAIYTLGHLSVTSRSDDHQLMAFWAPFLLLHLGGQDNIIAYAIEDNQLWLRHLQTLVVQVAAAAYVLYKSTVVVGTEVFLRNAAILMFVVGVIKYLERVWALKRASTNASCNSYRSFEKRTRSSTGPRMERRDTEGLLRIAHLLLDVPKDLLQGPLPNVVVHLDGDDDVIPADELYKVVEMQLSLMHDVVYTKAEVIHTWYGLCIHVISPVFIIVSFVLFHWSSGDQHSHSKIDIVITYVLLGGAVTLEMVSVLRSTFSRWPSVIVWKLAYDITGEERYMWSWLASAIAYVRRFVLPKRDGSRWWWSDSMGQHNLIDLCVLSRASWRSRIASWMGVEDWWNTIVYSSSVSVSTTIKELVVKQVLNSSQGKREEYYYSKSTEEEPHHIINSRGRATLEKLVWLRNEGVVGWPDRLLDMEFDESILVWHIATDIYLRWHKDQWKAADSCSLVGATEAISNYMIFLLAVYPHMLPGSATRYVDMCYCLTGFKYTSAKDLASLIMNLADPLGGTPSLSNITGTKMIQNIQKERCIRQNKTLHQVILLTRFLIYPNYGRSAQAQLKMVAQVWTEMLCYAGYRCSGYSHAKHLSNGGELLTIAALMVEYYRRNVLKPRSTTESLFRLGPLNHGVRLVPLTRYPRSKPLDGIVSDVSSLDDTTDASDRV